MHIIPFIPEHELNKQLTFLTTPTMTTTTRSSSLLKKMKHDGDGGDDDDDDDDQHHRQRHGRRKQEEVKGEEIKAPKTKEKNNNINSPPFPTPSRSRSPSPTFLPCHPLTTLPLPPHGNHIPLLRKHIQDELLTPRLDAMARRLWLVATPSSASISALHHQVVRGRTITITEKAELHLVWIQDRVFVKPLPECLLSYAFWRVCFFEGGGGGGGNDGDEVGVLSESSLRFRSIDERGGGAGGAGRGDILFQSALGYMRTYFHLIKHQSDFDLAVTHKLLPPQVRTFAEFARFIRGFGNVSDAAVSPRYHFGELRLARLNFWAKLFLRQFIFEEVAGQYETYFSRFFEPFLFAFGTLSVVLGAMQVSMNALQLRNTLEDSWDVFCSVSRWFAVLVIVFTLLVAMVLLALFLYVVLSELRYALVHKARKKDPSREVQDKDLERMGGKRSRLMKRRGP